MPLSYILQGTEIISYDVNVTQYTCICQIEFLALLYMKPQGNKNQKSLKWSCTEPESRLMHKGWEKRYQFGTKESPGTSSIIVGMVSWWFFLHVWEDIISKALQLYVWGYLFHVISMVTCLLTLTLGTTRRMHSSWLSVSRNKSGKLWMTLILCTSCPELKQQTIQFQDSDCKCKYINILFRIFLYKIPTTNKTRNTVSNAH